MKDGSSTHVPMVLAIPNRLVIIGGLLVVGSGWGSQSTLADCHSSDEMVSGVFLLTS